MRQTAEHLILQSKRSFSVNGLSQIEKIVYKEAQECMNALDKKLGNRPYFFGNSPSTLDAVVYGHLGLLFKAPLVSTELKVLSATLFFIDFKPIFKPCIRESCIHGRRKDFFTGSS